MIQKALKKKLFLILSGFFILFILYLFPTKDESNIKEVKENQDQTIIYLLDHNSYVSRVSVILKDNDIIEKAKKMINYLTIGSQNANYIKDGFSPIIPKGTKILAISLDKDLIKINFSENFNKISLENEEKMLSALIYSLTSIEGINKISIYVDGNILNKLPNSKKYLEPTLDRSYGINKIYDFTKIKGTNKTTVYYLSKYEDYYYYVPITMINNEQKDKIEIIINELASKSVYNTNLISYLNDSRKMSYEIKDEYLLINIQNSLFYDLSEENLIEKVIYSMNLAIKDNYNYKKVVYTTDDKIYKTYSL